MSVNKKGLGRGFGSLIPTELLDESFDPTAEQDEKISELRHIKLTEIVADPQQPRRHFDEVSLGELAASVREHGVLQPIVVTPYKGKYQIVAGERRWRAAGLAGLAKIPALVRTLSGQHKLELSLIENLQRRDLNVLETATAYMKLRDQFNLTLEQIGVRVGGKAVSSVSNTIRLLQLPDGAKDALVKGKLNEGQARALVGLSEAQVDEVLPRILREGWTARMVERYAAELKLSDETKLPVVRIKRQNTEHEAHMARLAKRFGAEVKIHTTSRGAGKIEIPFRNQKDFERIEKLLK